MQHNMLPEIVPLKKLTGHSQLLWFRMSKCERCGFSEDGGIGLLVLESLVTWRRVREIGTGEQVKH